MVHNIIIFILIKIQLSIKWKEGYRVLCPLRQI